jgi:cytochrome c oxidase cbb3-type subunit 3
MPTWEARFSPETIKALAVFVHVNAGGDAGPVVAANTGSGAAAAK